MEGWRQEEDQEVAIRRFYLARTDWSPRRLARSTSASCLSSRLCWG